MSTIARSRYLDDASQTASPGRLVVMLYERLVRDLERSEQAIACGEREVAHGQLVHAQEIVLELLASLDTSRWSDGEPLAHLYVYLVEQLIDANIRQDAAQVATCRYLCVDLLSVWTEALHAVGHEGTAA